MPATFGREDYYEQIERIKARSQYLDRKYGEHPATTRKVNAILSNAAPRHRFDPMELSDLSDLLETSYMFLRYGGHEPRDPARMRREKYKNAYV